MIELLQIKRRGAAKNFEELLQLAEDVPLDASQLVNTYRFLLYDAISRSVLEDCPELREFQGKEHDIIRADFVELDQEIIELEREKISAQLDRRPIPSGNGRGPKKTHTEAHLLLGEIQKQRRHVPIRQLTKRAGKALQAIKPCFMMGPLSVAQYLAPGELSFDLVIMDEASQLKPEDAIGAIARGRQMVIVGDQKQLPPTTFFEKTFGEDEDDEQASIEDAESILDVAATVLHPSRPLNWHYRSQHESLIAFSNYNFYDDSLIVFPSPRNEDGALGVTLERVADGLFQSGININEAYAVCRAAVQHMENCQGESLGVVAMNIRQREVIQELIDKELKTNPFARRFVEAREGGPEPFFVKNLENVQGDERDVVFISYTYARNSTGRFLQNFGPINQVNGWRRLNVLFTRAKKRVVVFSSVDAGDIRVDGYDARGRSAMRDYLVYADGGALSQPRYSDREADSDFEIAVAKSLGFAGYECEPQIGVAGYFIDLAVRDPDKPGSFMLGVECDGASYHSSASARDRDRLRQAVLENLGWNIYRIWSTDWFKNPEEESRRLMERIESLRASETHGGISTIPSVEIPSTIAESESLTAAVAISEQDLEDGQDLEQDVAPTVQPAPPRNGILTYEEARKELIDLRENEIKVKFSSADPATGVLRRTLLDALLRIRPTSKEAFLKKMPYNLRDKTDSHQIKEYLDQILEVIRRMA